MLKGYKTIIVNAAGFLLATLAVINPQTLPFDGEYMPWIMAGYAILNLWLRMITNTGVGKKE